MSVLIPSVRIEWRDQTEPWAEHDAAWPRDQRVPVPGEYIGVAEYGEDLRMVESVMWALDGSCVVRLRSRPR